MELDSIETVRKHGEYGNVFSQSPNANYRRYLSWFDKKYGRTKKRLSFKEWLVWAHEKELVQRNADAAPVEETEEKVEVEVKNTGKRIAMLVLVAASIGLVVAFAKTKEA